MSCKVKSVDNSSLETVVESDKLPEFLEQMEFLLKQKSDFEQKRLGYEWVKFLENTFYSDVIKYSGMLFEGTDKKSVGYYGADNSPYFKVGIGKMKFGGGDLFSEEDIEAMLECRIDPEKRNEMRVKAFFDHNSYPFRIIEDALLLSHPVESQKRTVKVGEFSSESREEYDISLRRGKDGYDKTRMLMAPVNRIGKVVEEAKDIYNIMGEYKIDALEKLKNSCSETIEDPHFGNTINIFRENKYQTALLAAMKRGTDYIFMD